MMRPGVQRMTVVALRIVRQLKRDRRTIALITFAPIFIMVLFGYSLSGEMTGVQLGLVDGGDHPALRSHLESIQDFDILRLGSESDAERLITEGRLDGAVVLGPDGVRVLLDASSLQIAAAVAAAVQAGANAELAARGKASASPLAGSISVNSSPISRQPVSPSSAASVDFPDPDSPDMMTARPSRATALA